MRAWCAAAHSHTPQKASTLQGEHQAIDPHAMPLTDYISETMALLETGGQDGEILVQRVHSLRFAAENNAMAQVFGVLNPA